MVKSFQNFMETMLGFRPSRRESKLTIIIAPVGFLFIYITLSGALILLESISQ